MEKLNREQAKFTKLLLDVLKNFYMDGFTLNAIRVETYLDIMYLFLEKNEKIHVCKFDMRGHLQRLEPHLLVLQEASLSMVQQQRAVKIKLGEISNCSHCFIKKRIIVICNECENAGYCSKGCS